MYRGGVKVALRVLVVPIVLVLVFVGLRHFYRDHALRAQILHKTDKHSLGVLEGVLFFPSFGAADAELTRLPVSLSEVARGLKEPTAIAFLPPPWNHMIVVERAGHLTRIGLEGVRTRWLDVEVSHEGQEQGLLDFAFHPDFGRNGRIFLSRTWNCDGQPCLLIDEYRIANPQRSVDETPALVREVLRISLPNPNLVAGALAFGPDDSLFIGVGDGGVEKQQRESGSLLGSILRLDVSDSTVPYKVPADNPVFDKLISETFARGVFMPRRLSFDRDGRLLVADHGERAAEEISVALPGDNLGFPAMEGRSCTGSCNEKLYRLPFTSYPRALGSLTTGGYIASATGGGVLRNLYVFGDRASGALMGVTVPRDEAAERFPVTLGSWPIAVSAIGRDERGTMYVADYRRGRIYRLTEPRAHWSNGLRDLFDVVERKL